jgi:two-component system chemotaxis response regulator CheB
VAYFAPREWLVQIGSGGILRLERGEKTSEPYPSVDVTLASLATQYGPALLAIFLSGIGDEGVQGALDVREAGGSVVVQEPATCVARETPQAVIEAGAATVVLPPERIADGILRQVRKG